MKRICLFLLIFIFLIPIVGCKKNSDKNYLSLPDYVKVIDRKNYQIWRNKPSGIKIVGLLRNIAVSYKGNVIGISTTGINGTYDKQIEFNSTYFPGLIDGSLIEYFLLVPWSRNLDQAQYAKNWRLVVITNKGQIYHNFPSRGTSSDGAEMTGDIIKFEESVVWDLPERKFPSKDKNATGVERYFPGLPDESYENHPQLNTNPSYIDTYGNGGFGKSITKTINGKSVTFPRFYMPRRSTYQNSFSPMGGYEPGDKITLLGTYKSNYLTGEGARIGVFATDDGGHSWYMKYEFTDEGISPNWVNNIDTSSMQTPYTANAFVIQKRGLVIPSADNKEPINKFTWGNSTVVSIITRDNPAVVTTVTPHGLKTGNIIVFRKTSNSTTDTSSEWNWMCNETVTPTSGGNGMMFKVEVVDPTSFKLHEFVHSAYNNLPARHIHHINRIKDGWMIGSGETYPNGWDMYMQMKEADSYSKKMAYEDFPMLRLNSAPGSVQRTLGAILLDDANNSFVFASDTAITERDGIAMPDNRTQTLSRSSTGIFKGKLSDIDNMSKFYPIYEAKQVAYFFKEKAGAWLFGGQRGEFAISLDKGKTWETEDLASTLWHFYGESDKFIVIDDFILVLK